MATIYDIADTTIIPNDEIDWSGFDPDKLDHVKHLLSMPLKSGTVEAQFLAAYQMSFGTKSATASAKGNALVDLEPLYHAKAVSESDAARAAESKTAYRLAIRAAYRAGATGQAVAKATGLSLPRINQLVSGARQEED